MKKCTGKITAMMVATIILSTMLSGCSNKVAASTSTKEKSQEPSTSESAQMENPWKEFGREVSQAENDAGFTLELPKMDDFSVISYSSIQTSVLEAYCQKEQGIEAICIRKGDSSIVGDNISGDYNNYQYVGKIEAENSDVEVKGNAQNKIYIATWQKDGYSYSFSASDGISQETLKTYIEQIK